MYQGKYTAVKPSAPQPQQGPQHQLPQRRPRPQRRKPQSKKGSIIFYSIYAAFIVLFFIAVFCVMSPLRDWLVKYEASQPNHKRDEIFSQLFADPDWEEIYRLAQVEDTAFENSRSFATGMEALVGDQELTCLETSAGLSGDKKYIVKLGDKKIASFTLTGGADSQVDIPQWELGKVEVFFERTESVTVQRFPGQTVYINGVALDDSYVIRKVSTVAEKYLPDGIQGFQLEQLQVTGLMVPPVVAAKDSAGNVIQLTQDSETGIYSPAAAVMEASTEEKALALNAVQTYAKYMIGQSGLWSIQQLYQTDSQFYQTLEKSELGWMQSYASYGFTDAQYSEYYRYSDSLFSIRIALDLQLTRHDGSVKTHDLNNTFFFKKGGSGKWMVMEATNVSVQERQEQVLLTFINEDTVIQSFFTDAQTSTLALPELDVPEGKVFRGWVRQDRDSSGKVTLTVVFPAEDGNQVYLPSDYNLEPMTLYALFEEVKG